MKKTIFFFLLLVSFIGCNTDAQSVETNQVLQSYYDVKNSLVADNSQTAHANAAKLLAALSSFPSNKLSEKQQKTWNHCLVPMKTAAQTIAQTKNISVQRNAFKGLSEHLFLVLKDLEMNQQTVYQQYCPMQEAYWLSNSSSIENPYHGKEMLRCGKVTSSLD